MITKVSVKNWRSHKDTSLEFSDGTNALIGIMGSGKTSLLDAICFGFFGTFPALQGKKIRLEDTVMKKPKEEKRADVEIEFMVGDDVYSVKRTIEGGRATAELRKDGKLIEAPQTQKVTDEVSKLLKIDYDLFTRAIYSEQNQLDMFLTIPKGQRMKKIDQLLSIDKFENARTSAVALSNRMKSLLSDKQRTIFSLRSDDLTKGLQDMRLELEAVRKDRISLHEHLRQTIQNRESISGRLDFLRKTDNERRRIDEESRTALALINSVREDIDRLSDELKGNVERPDEDIEREMDSYREKYDILKTSLDGEKLRLDAAKQMATIKETKVKMIEEEKLPDLKAKVKEKRGLEDLLEKGNAKKLKQELDKKTKELEGHRNEMQRAMAGIEETERSVADFHKVGDSCPVCDQKITEAKRRSILEGKREKISDLKKLIKDREKVILSLEDERTRLEAAVKDFDKLLDRYQSLTDSEKQMKFLEQALEQLEKEVRKHRSEVRSIEKGIQSVEKDFEKEANKIRSLQQIIEKRKEAHAKVQKAKDLEIRLTQLNEEKHKFLGFSSEDLERVERELQAAIGLEKGLEARIEGTENVMGEKQKRIADAEGKLEIIRGYESEVRKIEAIVDQLGLFSSALESTQNQLRLNFVSAVNQAMQMIWQDLYPYRDFSSARLGVTDGDYVLQLQGSDGWTNADGLVSGGERSIACLALRIAFSLVLAPQMRMLVLDEPTANLDARAMEDLATVLRERMNEFVDQVFLITHEPTMEACVSGHLYHLERDKANDGETKVIHISGPQEL